ncbi:MAG: hypothetical protein AAF821_14340 [Cyanobacteria bacterium P01_D01_bin.156]
MIHSDAHPVWEPIAPTAMPIGKLAPASLQSDRNNLPQLSDIAVQLLNDPLQVRRLTERVHQLMQADLHLQHERLGGYGCRQ